MSLPLLIPPAINVQDLDYWAEVVATPLHLLECLAPGPEDLCPCGHGDPAGPFCGGCGPSI